MTITRQIFENGYDRGYAIAENTWIENREQDLDDIIELTYQAEEIDRQFSPFEFTAKYLNDLSRDETIKFNPWGIYDKGLNEGINAYLKLVSPIRLKSQSVLTRNDLPIQAIHDCSQQGENTNSVRYWLKRLDFTVDFNDGNDYLTKEVGLEPESNQQELNELIFWIVCTTLRHDMLFVMGV